MADWLIEQLRDACRDNYAKWPDSPYGQSALKSDEHAARHNGAGIHDNVKRCEGRTYDAGSAIYRRYRTALEAAVRDGAATAWRPGPGAYVWYWPVGLSADLATPDPTPQETK